MRNESGPYSSTAPFTTSDDSDPAQPRLRFKQCVLDLGSGRARLFKLIGSRQSRNASANDRCPHRAFAPLAEVSTRNRE